MSKARSYLAAAGLLLLGGLLALVIEHAVLLHARPHTPAQTTHTQLMKLMDDELALTATQRDSVEAILERHQVAVDSAWRSIHRAVGATMDTVHQELEGVLDAQQLTKFRGWLREQHTLHR